MPEDKKTEKKLFAGKPGPGRPKGLQNKTTSTMKQAIAAVYDALQKGQKVEHGHFIEWAKKHPTEFYKIASKLLPLQISGDDEGGPVQAAISIAFVKTDEPRED